MLAHEGRPRAVAERSVRHVAVVRPRGIVEGARSAQLVGARVERIEVRPVEGPPRPGHPLAPLEVDGRERRVPSAELPRRQLGRPERRRAADPGRARRAERRVAPVDLALLEALPPLDEGHPEARLFELERGREPGHASARDADVGFDHLSLRNRPRLYEHLSALGYHPPSLS